jgi:ribosome-associated toxin RatA of RatAB toxin-antitoxin module
MKTVTKSVLIWYSPSEMYRLVTDIDQYPKFLPWCDQARVVSSDETGMVVEISILFAGIRQTFTTRNQHVLDRQVAIKLVNGPFSRLDGAWNFMPVGTGSERACRVELTLNYGFNNVILGKLVGPVFDKIADNMVEAFIKRAKQVYGD